MCSRNTAAKIDMRESKQAMLNRLARVEGQLRGIQKLISQDEECEKIIQQMSAARKALDKASHEMLACLIEEGVLAATSDTAPNREAMANIRTLLSKYS